jgi:hypothetical protein
MVRPLGVITLTDVMRLLLPPQEHLASAPLNM